MSLLDALYRGGWLRAVDHALAESLRRLQPQTADAVLVAAGLVSRAIAHGHSCLPLAQAAELLAEIATDRPPPSLPPLVDWLAALRTSPWVARPDSATLINSPLLLEDEAIYLRRYWQYETSLANALLTRLRGNRDEDETTCPRRFDLDRRLTELFPSPAQAGPAAEAARVALAGKLLLLTGGPGTGKTTTVARILALFAEQFASSSPPNAPPTAPCIPRVALAAPTGKAATRLAESVRENLAQLLANGLIAAETAQALPVEAKTLHRLLGWQRDTVEFRHNARQPLPVDLVVVDEASMIDLPLMSKLFEAIPAEACAILIGDRDQLPAVETGNVLAALCAAADANAIAHDPSPAALSAHRIHLHHSYRQANDIDVPRLAAWVRDGESAAALQALTEHKLRGVQWRYGSDRALADAALAAALPAYRAVQAAANAEQALACAKRFRLLTAVREGVAGSQQLNALIAKALDPAPHGSGFFPGRLILITENSYRHDLFNGDIGIVWPDPQGELRVWFEHSSGTRNWLPAALPRHDSAFALTVHKAQGSEFDRVFLALPECGGRSISRELLYTGLTRCRHTVTLWATAEVLRNGIARHAQRWSGLATRLTATTPTRLC